MPARRAVLLRRTDTDPRDVERLATEHDLEIVHTAIADLSSPRLSVLIAVQHVLECGVDVIIIPDLTEDAVRAARPWQTLVELVDVVTTSGVLNRAAESL